MNCIKIEDIPSTTVLYEGFFCYSEFFKFSEESINNLKEIANKYKKIDNDLNIDNENCLYLNNDNDLYLREFEYKFKHYIVIEKLIYPLANYDAVSYEIIDLSNKNEVLILSSKEINKDRDNIEIILKNIKVNHIKLRIKSRSNIWPKVSDIQIIKKHN